VSMTEMVFENLSGEFKAVNERSELLKLLSD
jgi:hypothetical protein